MKKNLQIDLRKYKTPPQLSRETGLGVPKIMGWIASSELRAFNVATRAGGKPRWLIAIADFEAFLAARAAVAAPKLTRARRKDGDAVVEYV